ncbi:MAG TPA: DUF2934 domain-containing protein [Verrucomicrobiae bacterium]|nr:DUF2934 domain-containing protein [Verrucomicrobiae bacterium]
MKKKQPAPPPALPEPENFPSLEDEISRRAHQIWEERGRTGESGSDVTDWLRAEREVLECHHQRRQPSVREHQAKAV